MLAWLGIASDMAGDAARMIELQSEASRSERDRTDEIRKTQLQFNQTLIELVRDFDRDLDLQSKRIDRLEGKKP